MEAEAFAYGARVTETLNLEYRLWSGGQDRDTLSAKLAEVKGDAPSRLRVEIRPSASMAGWSPWVNVTAVPEDSWSGPTVWQAEAFNPGSGYARQEISFGGPDPTAGNPYNVLRTFSSQSFGYAGAVAITGAAPSVPPPGRYTMLIRLITGDTVATAPSFRWGIQANGAGMYGMWRTWDKPAKSGQFASWLALDSFQLPAGVNPVGLSAQEGMAPTLALWHKGDGASATVYVDKILLVPAELAEGVTHNLNALAVNDGYGAASNSALLIDDEVLRAAIVTRTTPRQFFSAPPPKLNGGFPSVTPGLDNWLTLIPNVGTGGGDDASGPETFEVVVSYHPRYLHLAAS
ncbi:hypothetical protein IEE94_11220 [Yimella sp. cx-573]|nr:hypothetical protein [Yimella sp. cx-573]